MKFLTMTALVAASLTLAPMAQAEMGAPEQTYELLFKTGTLDPVARDQALVYQRAVTNQFVPVAEGRDTGQIRLSFAPDDVGGDLALLHFAQTAEQRRRIGQFPASVGNPIIMYFVETVVRDMAESVGGSPFYIRNRVKESLVQSADISDTDLSVQSKDVSGKVLVLKPFDGDPNVDRMQGFGALSLTVAMSEDVPGWYHSLAAEVIGGDGTALYSSVMTFADVEVQQ